MPRPAYRSRKGLRIIKVRTPGGRPYAGFLDHRCLREGIKKAVRLMAGAMQ